MWSLYEDEKELSPLIFSNGKTQEDIVKEVIDAAKNDYKVIFIKGMCGTGKSAIALNLANHFGRTSVVVPIKSLQEQYTRDYTEKKYVLNNGKKLKIYSIAGRQNFKCRFLEEFNPDYLTKSHAEKDAKLTDIFGGIKKTFTPKNDNSCDNNILPCKIEIREKNLPIIKDYIKQNPSVNFEDFDSINEIKRMSIAPVCPYWSPIFPAELEMRKFKDSNKIEYQGLNNKKFIIYERKPGCIYYNQYHSYSDADVIIFNSSKYIIETLLNRKPSTELEIIDECDDFLDSLSNQEQINLNRLLFSLNSIFTKNNADRLMIDNLIDIVNAIKASKIFNESNGEIFELKNTLIQELLEAILKNSEILELIGEDSNYIFHLDKVARTFENFFEETFLSIEKKENDLIINLVTTNLEKRFKEIIEKNKILVLMSGTVHSEKVLKNIFGLEKFKIIKAETQFPGELIKCKHGYEFDCSYESFKKGYVNREQYLKSLSKSICCAKKPVLVHVHSFSDLPNEQEKINFNLDNLPTREELIKEQIEDPFGEKITNFKNKKSDILFTTKCSRGIDFPGDVCNSIVITRFPYPNISSIFWKILKRNNPQNFMSFYMDKAKREILQKIYRGIRSKNDKVYLLSPDIRVLNSKIE